MAGCCDMKGFLSFLVLKLISKKAMSGEEIALELERRKGHKPSPGTIYPVLKSLKEKKLIKEISCDGKDKRYELTAAGKREVEDTTIRFVRMFCDMKEEFKR